MQNHSRKIQPKPVYRRFSQQDEERILKAYREKPELFAEFGLEKIALLGNTKLIKVTLRKSIIGCNEKQRATVKSLGLKKINSTQTYVDAPQIRGMISKVRHLVEVEEV